MLSVVTEPVVLEGVDLGRFEIALDAGSGPHREWGTYEVIALGANPAASDSEVTHPRPNVIITFTNGRVASGDAWVLSRC